MKGRESGMPDEDYWQTFFDVDCLLSELNFLKTKTESVVEFGSGYGTFTLPTAARTSGQVFGLDIEPELVSLVRDRAAQQKLMNVDVRLQDFVASGTGLDDESVDHAMLFNILHIESPVQLLREALRVLRPSGSVSISHWNRDPRTPRGPSMEVRPRPEQCKAWAEEAGFSFLRYVDLAKCSPYHYGMLLEKPEHDFDDEAARRDAEIESGASVPLDGKEVLAKLRAQIR